MSSEVDAEQRVRRSYDAVAADYHAALADELADKPLDRALLAGFCELCPPGPLADVGCGPGHVTRFLAGLRPEVSGVDLSPAMIALASAAAPELAFATASMLDLPFPDGSWAGAVALYSVIHLDAAQRAAAFLELARVLQPGGGLLVSFHVSATDQPAGSVVHHDTFFGHDVDLDGHYLAPGTVTAELRAAGLAERATLLREPSGPEFPSRRCYVIAARG